ncbi:SbcC/MukB-like Walker B domain-containing protein [Actinoplanes sp. NPDC089786]|uniref:SbcC/MukB-like Walker B domain-containing protein n=1 Tax=Actinoplanes sp. NPDC089786 TaxID=3155185 RepID=UPI00342D732C
MDRAGATLPPRTAITQAERDLDRAATLLRVRRESALDAAGRLDAAVAGQAAAATGLRRASADRSLPVERLDPTATALDRFDRLGMELRHAHDSADIAGVLAGEAAERQAEAEEKSEAAGQAARTAHARHDEKDEELRTLSASIGAEATRVLAEVADTEEAVTDAEQRVFEDALLGQLAGQIHRRTIEARDLVDAMDQQMRARRMSSGLTVGVGWRLSDDLDPEQREVCKLLERDPARLGPGQLTTLRRHFAARIKSVRAQAPEKPYRELLAEVLDYRQWRVFAFTLHRPGGVSEPLTRARHSQLSGGEQSVSLHLPLFAAANALFGSARPDAPRLLGLDEAFASVDDNGRGELMSLAKQFDLDLFMTGYDLWATHPAVTGCAHYDLSHSTVEHAVSTVLLVWDGTVNVADFDGTLAAALGSPSTRTVASHA